MAGSNSGVKVSCSLIGPFYAKIHHEHTVSKMQELTAVPEVKAPFK